MSASDQNSGTLSRLPLTISGHQRFHQSAIPNFTQSIAFKMAAIKQNYSPQKMSVLSYFLSRMWGPPAELRVGFEDFYDPKVVSPDRVNQIYNGRDIPFLPSLNPIQNIMIKLKSSNDRRSKV